jgi:hypothetical protein
MNLQLGAGTNCRSVAPLDIVQFGTTTRRSREEDTRKEAAFATGSRMVV